MKRTLIGWATLLVLGTSAVAAQADAINPAVTRLPFVPEVGLIIGNSHSYYNCGVNNYLKELARAAGIEWKARMATISGARLAQHDVTSYVAADKPADKFAQRTPLFDVVILQGQSTESISKKHGQLFADTVAAHAKTIRAAGAEPVLVMQWAKADKPHHTARLMTATTQVANANRLLVAPVGEAFAKSLALRPDLTLHMPDGRHPTAAGSYLYGAVLFAVLFQRSPEGLAAYGRCEKPLAPNDALHLQRVAWETVTHHLDRESSERAETTK